MTGTILKMPSELRDIAKMTFNRITFTITEQLTRPQILDLTKKIVKAGLKNTDEIKDEIYFQLIKQVRSNTKMDSQLECWILFACVSCHFGPSYSSVYPILNYLQFIS